MKANLKGKHVLIVLDIGQNLLAGVIEDSVLSEYNTNVEQILDRENKQINICVDEADVNLNQKNKQHANDMKHFCRGIEIMASALE